jgi:hypothetical protein
MARFDSIYDFRKSALHRLGDAKELLQRPTLHPAMSDSNSRHLRGAMYLAGYAVECILKAYLINLHQPLTTLTQVDTKLRSLDPALPNLLSAEGHRIGILLAHTDLEVYQNQTRKRLFGLIASNWNVDMRYNPQSPSRLRTVEIVNAAEELYYWINGRI